MALYAAMISALASSAMALPATTRTMELSAQPVFSATLDTEVMSFEEWTQVHDVRIAPDELEARKAIYAETIATIESHNRRADAGLETFRMGVNQFSAMTHDEWVQHALSPTAMPIKDESELNIVELPPVAADAAVDWREKGAVTPVKNQGGCGSCWAFSTTGSTEGAFFLATGQLRSLSEQQLVDCAGGKFGDKGCKGGIMENGFKYIIANGGIDSEGDYNYTAKDGVCWTAAEKRVVATINNYTDVKPKSADQMAAAVMKNPVSIAIEADHPYFQHYKSGILTNETACGEKLDHGVLVVGMDTDYWIVKNSWGPGWGDKGYVKLSKDVSDPRGMCGLLTQPTYPVVNKGTAPPIPPPTPGPRPEPKPPHYEHPYGNPYKGPCEAGEQDVSITGLPGKMCCPECSPTTPCPTNVPSGTTAQPQCALGQPGQPPSICALICKADNFFAQRTELNDLVCPQGASCHPIQTTALCTYSDGPAPPPGPPAPPSSGDYGDPNAGPCKPTEEKVQIQGLQGSFCSPKCSPTSPCPTDVPAGTTAKGQCVLQTPGGSSPTQCALICKSNDPFTLKTMLNDLACPAKASCKPIQTTAICTYDSR